MALSPGSRLGPYEVTALIGQGGMGEVYQGAPARGWILPFPITTPRYDAKEVAMRTVFLVMTRVLPLGLGLVIVSAQLFTVVRRMRARHRPKAA